ncbi:MAG: AtpZ/AtpI family protein [Arachnia sp.]
MGTTTPPRGGNTDDGMVALSYILAGLIFYGGLGWLGDHYLHTQWLLPVGLILGLATSTYLIIKRYGRLE